MKQISSNDVARALEGILQPLACCLNADVCAALTKARDCETSAQAARALSILQQNAACAAADTVPLCQDTGSVWVELEIGPDVSVSGDVFSGVDGVVAAVYRDAALRKSMVRDALLDRSNSQDNTPAFCEIRCVDKPGVARLNVMLKGGGSDNASRVVMLAPGAGRQGIIDAVVSCVREKGANACPPLTIGVGIGATFDTVGHLAKRALMRPIGSSAGAEVAAEAERAAKTNCATEAERAAFEAELLAAVNATGVGAAGLGGPNTAFAVHVETAPCHIAALPVAINMGCCALRRASVDLMEEATIGGAAGAIDAQPATSPQPADVKSLSLPLSKTELAKLRVGDNVELTGVMYTLRDAGHMRLLEELAQAGKLPYELEGATIFYAGPSPACAGRPFGSIGPTTASRMDFAAPTLYDAGIAATIGKGTRNNAVCESCAKNSTVFFTTVGGAAAYLAQCVTESSVVAYDELGTEALRKIVVDKFPATVGIDTTGAQFIPTLP